jgi:UDP:flavonoid glycosyltransferase YjiC (YdhE family)
MCGVLPLSLSSRDTAPFGMGLPPAAGALGRIRNALLATVAGRILAPAQRLAEGMYRELHGHALPGTILDWARNAEAIAQFTVPEFEYPRPDAPANLHFVGPISASGSSAPRPGWWADLEGRRVVHVTQGTIANKDFGQLVGPTLQALADDDVLVVVSTGGRPLDTLPPLPANARAAVFLPYDDLLPRTDAYVTNGGYGGVQYALRYGVPIVASGGQEDKPEVGARIAWSGVGRRLKAVSPTPQEIRRAVQAVLHDGRYRAAAAAMAERMARSGGLDALSRIVDDVVQRRAPAAVPGARANPPVGADLAC